MSYNVKKKKKGGEDGANKKQQLKRKIFRNEIRSKPPSLLYSQGKRALQKQIRSTITQFNECDVRKARKKRPL